MHLTSSTTGTGRLFRTEPVDRIYILRTCTLAVAAVFAFATGTACAMSSMAVKEDTAQLKADRAALVSEVAQFQIDEKKLNADAKAGKMAAESKDSELVYLDRQAIRGQKMALASDKPGSLQMQADRAALNREQSQLRVDREALRTDTASGKLSAMSQDAEKVYKDRLNIRGERKDIAADIARLKADERG